VAPGAVFVNQNTACALKKISGFRNEQFTIAGLEQFAISGQFKPIVRTEARSQRKHAEFGWMDIDAGGPRDGFFLKHHVRDVHYARPPYPHDCQNNRYNQEMAVLQTLPSNGHSAHRGILLCFGHD